MAIYKKIIKIKEEEYHRLKKDYGTLLDLYISDNEHYVIGKLEDLKACGINLSSPFY
tara:strand:+ start:175 stop:345 length:171 start_codon:yes stop_codon:yes gene_type:complete